MLSYNYLINMKATLKSFLFICLLSLMAISISARGSAQYPAYIWSQNIDGKKTEIVPEEGKNLAFTGTSSSIVSDQIKKILDSTDANSFIIYHRPGMTTERLANTLVKNYKIGNILRESSPSALEISYTHVIGTSLPSVVQKAFDNVKVWRIDSKESLENLKKELATSPQIFIHQYYVIELPYEKDSIFDDVVYQIERAFATKTKGNHVSILAGSEIQHRNLDEVDVTPTDTEPNVNDDVSTFQYLDATILTKILILIPMAFLLLIGLLQLFYIKTPTLFVEKGIDFGKIEK